MFDLGRYVWDAATVAKLRTAFVENLDLSAWSFLDTLRDQLDGAGDDVVLLAAETLTLLLLPADDWKGDAKRSRVKTVLGMMANPVHIDLGPSVALDKGVYGAGLTLKTLIWRSLSTLIEIATAWWALDQAGRDAAWNDPWTWRDLVESAGGDTIPAARYELCYLAHPETFPLVISKDDRIRIREAFRDEVPELSSDIDKDLYDITMALQEKAGQGKVDYYYEPFVSRWRYVVAPPSGRRAWLVRPGQGGAALVGRWHAAEYASVLAKYLGEIDSGTDAATIRAAVDTGYRHDDYASRQAPPTSTSTFSRA